MIGDTGQDVGEPSLWIDVVEATGRDHRQHDGGTVGTTLATGEGPVPPSQCDASQGALSAIIGQADPAIVEWPDEPSSLEPFCKKACSLAIVPNHLQKIAAFAPEAEKTTAHSIVLEHFLHAQSQGRKATPHVRMARRQPHSHARRERDQRSVSSPRMIRSKTTTSTLWSTITRRPFAVTISKVPVIAGAVAGVVDWISGTIWAGTNPSA